VVCPSVAAFRSPAVGPLVPICTTVAPSRAAAIGPVDSPNVVYAILSPRSLRLTKERAWMLLLGPSKLLVVESEIGRGVVDEVEIDLDWALACVRRPGTPYCVLAHNHPSGSAWPSWQDVRLTREMGRAAWSQGIELLDHVILGRGEFYSFHHQKGARA
jgi:DNA repair protein RadC